MCAMALYTTEEALEVIDFSSGDETDIRRSLLP